MLERDNPGWDDERVFQTARNINIVLLIKLVVEEYINHISPYWMRLLADPTPAYTASWNRENWIPVEFNLLYRWHSLVPTSATWGGASVDLAGLRFDNRMLLRDGLVTALAGASQTRAWRIGLFNTAPMLDAVEAASIQQGRANRLASYNDYRALMKYPRVTRFEQISSDPLVVSELRRIYSDVDRIEFFVGLFAEELPAALGCAAVDRSDGSRRRVFSRADQPAALPASISCGDFHDGRYGSDRENRYARRSLGTQRRGAHWNAHFYGGRRSIA